MILSHWFCKFRNNYRKKRQLVSENKCLLSSQIEKFHHWGRSLRDRWELQFQLQQGQWLGRLCEYIRRSLHRQRLIFLQDCERRTMDQPGQVQQCCWFFRGVHFYQHVQQYELNVKKWTTKTPKLNLIKLPPRLKPISPSRFHWMKPFCDRKSR